MYYTKSVFVKKASFQPGSTLSFFMRANALANNNFKKGIKPSKKEQIVVYGTTVKEFDANTDGLVARTELNDRGLLRDFIGMDWDFDDFESYQKLKEHLVMLSKQYQTPILFYPTSSYPKKPHCRTIMFSKNLMEASEYAKAATWVEKVTQLDADDDGNYRITHSINAPAHLSPEAYEESGWYFNGSFYSDKEDPKQCLHFFENNSKPLENGLWEKVKPAKNIRMGNRNVKEYDVSQFEKDAISDKNLEKGLKHLQAQIENNVSKQYDFDNYYSFMQFMHALARGEVLGALTRDQVVYILRFIAQGNREYEENNIKDYLIELKRVANNELKLKRARPLSFYFGVMI